MKIKLQVLNSSKSPHLHGYPTKLLYAGVEALKFPYGGISYIAQLFSCSRNTIRRGINEPKEKATIPKKRDRKAGGGRKQAIKKQTDINDVLHFRN